MRKAIFLWIILCALNLLACENTTKAETTGTAFWGKYKDSMVLQFKEAALQTAETVLNGKTDMDILFEDKMFLADMDIHPLYAAFLRNEISVANPYAQEEEYISPYLSFFDDRQYAPEHVFETSWKYFALVDVNQDGNPELAFKICNSPSELLYLLGVCDNELICFDVFETHTTHIGFDVYDNGNSYWGQNSYETNETIYYTYTSEGKARELIHFVIHFVSENAGAYTDDYYYLDGDETSKHRIADEYEYMDLNSLYRGENLEWYDCESFIDIPKK